MVLHFFTKSTALYVLFDDIHIALACPGGSSPLSPRNPTPGAPPDTLWWALSLVMYRNCGSEEEAVLSLRSMGLIPHSGNLNSN